jgi:Collagenase and related proteases
MKSSMYTAVVTGVYRQALDAALKGDFKVKEKWIKLLNTVSNRTYTKGFYADEVDERSINYKTSSYVRGSDFLGVVNVWTDGKLFFHCKGKIVLGEEIEILTPSMEEIFFIADEIYDKNGDRVEFTKPNYDYFIKIDQPIPEHSIIRRLL